MYPRGKVEELTHIWTGSDWAGDTTSRRSCSGGDIQHMEVGNFPLKRDPGECRALLGEGRVKQRSAGYLGRHWCVERHPGIVRRRWVLACASPNKVIQRHVGAWKVKRLSPKQRWVQGAIECYGVEAQMVPHTEKASDMLTHPMGESQFEGRPLTDGVPHSGGVFRASVTSKGAG